MSTTGTIYIISGNWETADSPAGGLQLESYELLAMFAGTDVNVVRLAFNSDLAAVVAGHVGDVALIEGHSFGGRTALMLAELLGARGVKVHLILLDPVRWEPGNLWAQFFPPRHTFELPGNVVSCSVYVRSDIFGPITFYVQWPGAVHIQRQTVSDTDHVRIIAATNHLILGFAPQVFQSNSTDPQ